MKNQKKSKGWDIWDSLYSFLREDDNSFCHCPSRLDYVYSLEAKYISVVCHLFVQ